MEDKWWVAALAGVVLALLPWLFLIGKMRLFRPGQDPELVKILQLAKALSKGEGPLSFRQVRLIEKADPWVMYRVLVREFEHWSEVKQLAVGNVLARLGYIERAIKQLESPHAVDRTQAAELLGLLRSPTAVGPLLEKLSDPDEEVRLAAAGALRRVQDPVVVPYLLHALENPDRVTPARAADVLIAMGQEVVDAVLEAAEKASGNTKGLMIAILGEIGDKRAVPFLVQQLNDTSPIVRERAAEALGHMRCEEAGPPLIDALRDTAPQVRARAAQALGEMGCWDALPALSEARKDPEWVVRASANQAITEIMRKNQQHSRSAEKRKSPRGEGE